MFLPSQQGLLRGDDGHDALVMIVGLDLAGTINTVISDNECIAVAQCNM